MAQYAVAHSPFFRRHYWDSDLRDFFSLPTVNKKIMMDQLTDYNTMGLTREEILAFCLAVENSRDFSRRYKGLNLGMSSGTSGNKGVEITTPNEESYMRAAFLARFPWQAAEKINAAFILRVSSPAFTLDRFGHKLTYISQLTPLEIITSGLANLRPNVIAAPPSTLKLIAREVEAGRLAVRLRRVVAFAEILYPDVKDYLARAFRCEVHEIYKCTEGPIAISCKYGSLHINEDLVLIETLNDDGTPTPPGEPCRRLIVTDLHKKSQPIIRYELNDILTISPGACACGSSFRVIERIQGRADDLFWSRDLESGRWRAVFPDYISRAIITASDDIEEYQATQISPGQVTVRIQLKSGVHPEAFDGEAVIRNIRKVFADHGCRAPGVSIESGNPELSRGSGKLTRIRREFPFEDDIDAAREI